MQETEISIKLPIIVKYETEPGQSSMSEGGLQLDPEFGESVTIEKACIGSVDITGQLTQEQMDRIKEEVG